MNPDPKRKAFDEKVARIRAGPGTMMIHLALESLPDWRAGNELKRFAYVHVAPDLAMMAAPLPKPRRVSFRPSRCWSSVSRLRSTRAEPRPASTCCGSRFGSLPATIAGDALGLIPVTAWDEAKEPYAERVLDMSRNLCAGRAEQDTRARHLVARLISSAKTPA